MYELPPITYTNIRNNYAYISKFTISEKNEF